MVLKQRLKHCENIGFCNSRKGLSTVIATISIILLTVVSVGIIATLVIPLVRDNLEDSTACIPYKDVYYFEEEFGYNCFKPDGNENWYGISIGAEKLEEENKLIGFDLFFSKSGESSKVSVREGNPNGNSPGNIRMIDTSNNANIVVPNSGEVRTYVYITDNTNLYESVDVAPVLEGGRVCEKSDSIKLSTIECNNKNFGS
jgi:hypothetical protein